jgi:asparagine synthase (glutamine-hydrolysing)
MIGSEHHEYLFSREEMEAHLSELVDQLETWDITTIRASMGMSLLCRYIRAHTDVKVLLTGEVSDELFGYKYTDFAPSPEAFQEEAVKRVSELYVYDILRADRCISMHGLEARVPFSDPELVSYVMALDPALKMNRYGIGKYLLRAAFMEDEQGQPYLPEHILYREKAAFSDAVGHSMVDYLKESAALRYGEEELARASERFPHAPPFTPESLWYRELFESHHPGRAELIPAFWMPNASWEGCAVSDPSARALSNYGASGSVLTEDAKPA